MDKASGANEKVGSNPWCPFLIHNLLRKVIKLGKKIKKIGKEDPRRILHSLKVGIALTLVSIFYYVTPLFNGLGSSTMWAVLTVVVVMEYTVGGTLSKGLNRAFATLLAGALGLGAHQLASLAGAKGEPILMSIFVFMLGSGATMATFSRFVPEIKARYDYGVTIFILTFSLVSVSSYRVEELISLAHQRLSTVAIGVATCLFTSLFVFPVWAGGDLHKLVAANLDKLACFLEGLGAEFFVEKMENGNVEGKSFLQSYKSVLNSKATEDSLANFARWEPGHGPFSFRHPWNQYLKIGAITRQFACSIEALNAYISTLQQSHHTTASDPEFKQKIQTACAEMSSETGKALAELASAIRQMKWSSAAGQHLAKAMAAASSVKAIVPAEDSTMLEILRLATIASLLTEVVRCANQVVIAVEELGRLAEFQRPEHGRKAGAVKPIAGVESPPHVVIDIEK
ncbi:aluminum-activated malate transporter 1-like [Phalaenopsis equestris]|uniref:aluminum-activated malate transporter 1-like n=1 Tax=Phalaenopsis equestris TaxID=78828 RepID=UPI0009E1E305|nr:aluminum-activated malate transporter 1-like [Phalaenopsis equestris]